MHQENTILEGQSTEEKIKEAAARVFIKKGYAATKTRDIADEAGINIASLHYYYRSKEKLFEIVFGEALKKFLEIMDGIFGSDTSLEDKIRSFTEQYIDFFKRNPYIPIFIISESQHNPETAEKMLENQTSLDKLKKQLKELSEKGIIRKMHHAHFMLNMVSLTLFPFISKPVMLHKANLSSKAYDELLEERKKMIPEIIINHMYLKRPN